MATKNPATRKPAKPAKAGRVMTRDNEIPGCPVCRYPTYRNQQCPVCAENGEMVRAGRLPRPATRRGGRG